MEDDSTQDWFKRLDRRLSSKPGPPAKALKYAEADLKGIQVDHSLADFEPGTSKILVAQDVNVLEAGHEGEGEDLRLVMPNMVARKQADSSKRPNPTVALSFLDDEEEAARAEPKHFRIGEAVPVASPMPGAPPKEGKHGAFDATLFTTAEAIAGSGPSLGRRKRPARKRTADLFTDDPTLLAKAGPPRSLATGDEGAGFDDDRDLNVAIAEARKKNIELLRQRQLFSALEEDAEMEDATPRPEAQGSLVISDVSEFLASVKKPGRVKKGEAVAVEPAAREEPGAAAQQPDAAMQTALPSAADEAPPAEFGEEPLVSKGVGATLAFLQMRGMGLRLGTGRAVDSMPAASPFPDIKLVYRDEFGGEISQKEAYKMLSHRFHGKRPGKNKEEKRLQRKTETAKLLGATLGDTPLGSGSLLRKKQAATGTSHIVLARGKTGAKPDQAELNVGGKPPVQKEASTSKKPGPLASAKKPRIFGML